MERSETEQSDWPLRPWVLAGGLALAGLLAWAFSKDSETIAWRMAATGFVLFGSIAGAFTLERDRWKEPLAFSILVGLVLAGIAWRATAAGDRYSDEQFWVAAGLISTGLALPLFQAGFHRTRFATPYERVHHHVWSDGIGAAGSLAFVGASWLLLVVLSELFQLLRIDLLRALMSEEWFGWAYSGAAFGAALGTLRNQLKILGTVRALAMTVLSILAVPLAAGLALFLVALALAGPQVLWDATRSATPVLLLCAAGAWILANAILRESDRDMTGNRVLRWSAFALAFSILPLTVFAAVSLGTRIDQHGLSPERLWGMIAVAVACLYGLAWMAALVRGWKGGDWRQRLRRANLHIAAAICVIAFVLALPIFDFGAVAARNQVARLESGTVAPEDFDYGALRWDFGDAGRRALARLERSDDPKVAELAALAQKQTGRTWQGPRGEFRTAEEIDVRVVPNDTNLRRMVIDYLRANGHLCEEFCVALDLGPGKKGGREVAFVENGRYHRVGLPSAGPEPIAEPAPAPSAAFGPASVVEIREVPTRYIFVNGRAIGPPLDDVSALEGSPPPR